jgi:hypothetical protein
LKDERVVTDDSCFLRDAPARLQKKFENKPGNKNKAQQVGRVDSGESRHRESFQAFPVPARGGVALRQHKTGQQKKRLDREIATAEDALHGRG